MHQQSDRVSTVGRTGVAGIRIHTETVDIPGVTGAPMTGYLARPDTDAVLAGVVVGMELFGVSAHVRETCDRLAGLGFLALAPDLYHRHSSAIELPEDEGGRARGFQLQNELTRVDVIADIRATVALLHARCGVLAGMLGLSVGGHLAYLAATEIPLPAIALAYAGWLTTTDIAVSRPDPTVTKTSGISGRVLFLVGDHDHLTGENERRDIAAALAAAAVDHELVVYPGAGHGFLNTRRDTYHRAAAQDAWHRIERLFRDAAAATRGAAAPTADDHVTARSMPTD